MTGKLKMSYLELECDSVAAARVDSKLARIKRRLTRAFTRQILRYETTSAISGVIQVIDRGRERSLRINGETHSIMPTSGSWNAAERECWGAISASPFALADNPSVLMCGLGGGTALHLLRKRYQPRLITVLELDPEIISVAYKFFGIQEVPGLTVNEQDAAVGLEQLHREGKKYDLIVDDVFFSMTSLDDDRSRKLFEQMTGLLNHDGTIIFNRPVDKPEDLASHQGFLSELATTNGNTQHRNIRGRWHNTVIYHRPLAE
jgi:predicted membrane-bound spermidine synthase